MGGSDKRFSYIRKIYGYNKPNQNPPLLGGRGAKFPIYAPL